MSKRREFRLGIFAPALIVLGAMLILVPSLRVAGFISIALAFAYWIIMGMTKASGR